MKNAGKSAAASSARTPSKSASKDASTLPAPEELMEQYAALVWKTAAACLENPEDIKECVNDTFLEFYLHSDRYDPGKGSYAAFLCTIARRKAINRYRKNRKASGISMAPGGKKKLPLKNGIFHDPDTPAGITNPADMADPSDMAETVAGRLDLEAALQSLKPEEFDIIRMKYYGGMTIKEIADSLHLSYETVKKRHQRSLTKLQKALTIGLILALIAALAACAYVVLRYFGIVPGYGVNTNGEMPFYVLEEPVSAENDEFGVELEKAFWNNGELSLTLQFRKKEAFEFENQMIPNWYQDLMLSASSLEQESSGESLSYERDLISDSNENPENIHRYQFHYTVPEKGLDETLLFRIQELSLSFCLTPARELPLENYGYELSDLGGFMADAYIRDGHLMADLYPLNVDGYRIAFSASDVTAAAEDGTVLTGSPVRGEFPQSEISTLDFGPAEEGHYLIRFPYASLTAAIPEAITIPLPALEEEMPDNSWPLPGGSFSILGWDTPPVPEEQLSTPVEGMQRQELHILYTPDREDLTVVIFAMTLGMKDAPQICPAPSSIGNVSAEDSAGQNASWGLSIAWPENINAEELCIRSDGAGTNVMYRWNHAFSIPVTAPRESDTPQE